MSIAKGQALSNVTFPVDREEKRTFLLQAVEQVRDAIKDSVTEAETSRTLPNSLFEAIYESGLFWMKLPELLGGAEADPLIQMEVIESLARVDASAAWNVMIGSQSIALPAAWLPDASVAEIFASDDFPVVAGSLMPSGVAIPVTNGFRVTGRWSFASGIRHCRWVNATVRVEGTATTDGEMRRVVIPTADVVIHDNWHSLGLQGTGSCDFSVSDYFVSDDYSWAFSDKPRRGGRLHLLGLPGYVAYEHAALALGVGRNVLDLVTQRAKGKGRGFNDSLLGNRETFQRDLGKFDIELIAMRSMIFDLFGEVWDGLPPGEQPAAAQQAQMRSAATLATEVALEVARNSFRYAGGEAVYGSDPIQKCWRDLATASQHFLVSDSAYENHAKFLLGREDAHAFG